MTSRTARYYEAQPRGFLKVEAGAEIPAVTGKKVCVLGYSITAGKTATLTDGTTTVSINGSFSGGSSAPVFDFKVGEKVTVGGEGTGHLSYLYA